MPDLNFTDDLFREIVSSEQVPVSLEVVLSRFEECSAAMFRYLGALTRDLTNFLETFSCRSDI